MRYLIIIAAIILSASMAEAYCKEPNRPTLSYALGRAQAEENYWLYMMQMEEYKACLIKEQIELLEDIKQKLEED